MFINRCRTNIFRLLRSVASAEEPGSRLTYNFVNRKSANNFFNYSSTSSSVSRSKPKIITVGGDLKLCNFQQQKRFSSKMTVVTKVHEDGTIIKSAADSRKYRGLELSNGMKILLVSDPETDKSSAAMDVYIGHLKDPRDIPGLAHFCEHMLFLGTEKYPEENEYSKFLSEHGGMSNAFTSTEHTNFYFDVSPDNLAGALDRFSQFFCSPLFTPSATGREVNAVDSENNRNLQSDPWRLFQLEKSLAKSDHDFSKFGTGNKETLETNPKARGVDVRDSLLEFHSKYYSSNIMGCCVVGRESLDVLQEMVVPLFEKCINKNVQIPRWDNPPYTETELQQTIYAVPVKDVREMSVAWLTPDLSSHYKTNPGHYLGHLLGHEGAGSLLSELKTRGWATTLVGGQRPGAKGFSFFTVGVDLTDKGQENVDEIVLLIYQYINMLRQEGAKEWIFNECRDLAKMAFNFKDKESPTGYTSGLASKLHKYPMEDVLSSHALFNQFNPELIDLILDRLEPTNMRVTVVSKKFESEADQSEQWYGTRYKIVRFAEEQMVKWNKSGLHENLHLPMKNDFIPTNFDLVERVQDAATFPEVIKNTPLTRLWYKMDEKFLKPKACFNLDLISPVAYIDPMHANMNNLFTQLFDDALTEYSYMADIAGLTYHLDSSIYGLTLTVRGYSDKIVILLQKILEKMTTFKVDQQRLVIFKEIRSRYLKNFKAEQPHQHAIFYTNLLMSEVLWTKEELLQALDDITLESQQNFITQMLSTLHMEALAFGNITKTQSLTMMSMVEDILQTNIKTKPLLSSQNKRNREVQLPDGCYFVYKQKNVVHDSSSLEVYYQCGQQATETNMLLELFCQVISEPCFNILRTKEQLGYIVFSGVRRMNGVQGLRVIVQSAKPPEFVEKRIEAFLYKMKDVIQDLTDEEFAKHISALSTKRLEKPKKLMQQNAKYWQEIMCGFYNFNRDDVEVTLLKTLKKDDLLKFYKDKISVDAPRRHKLSVYVTSDTSVNISTDSTDAAEEEQTKAVGIQQPPELPSPKVVTDVMEFKRDLALYPLPKPFIDISQAKAKL